MQHAAAVCVSDRVADLHELPQEFLKGDALVAEVVVQPADGGVQRRAFDEAHGVKRSAIG